MVVDLYPAQVQVLVFANLFCLKMHFLCVFKFGHCDFSFLRTYISIAVSKFIKPELLLRLRFLLRIDDQG